MPEDDGIKRDQLDYRAGYVEGLAELLQLLQLHCFRATKKEEAGIKLAFEKAQGLRAQMLEKMKGGAK